MSLLPFEKEKRRISVRQECKTSDKYGCIPEERGTDELIEYGIVTIDKPPGPTSHQVSAHVKQILEINKAGHTGTLDPAVTGVLPVALGKGTRISHALLSAGKEYICLMHLHDDVDESKIYKAVEEFKGNISQLPPVRSAIKRRTRTRKIYYLDILEVNGRDVLFKVGCQAGTYIRKLCHDIGVKIGIGAHMLELRRTKAGPFGESLLVTLQDLLDAFHVWKKENNDEPLRNIILPVEKGVEHLPKVWVMDTTVDSLSHGASLKMPGISKLNSGIRPKDLVAVMTLKNELVLIGTAVTTGKEMLHKTRGIAIKPLQVFMPPKTYPKMDK